MSFLPQYTLRNAEKKRTLFRGCIPVGEFKNQHPIAEDGYYELGFVLLVILLRIVPS